MDLIGKRFGLILVSIIVVLIGVVSLTTFGRLKAGIEFSSGSILGLKFETAVDQQQLTQEINNLGYQVIVQHTGDEYLIRTHEINDQEKSALEAALTQRFGNLTETQFSSVSPLVATETAHNAAIAVAASAVGILLYITWAFRRMPRPFHYGVSAIIALSHDILVTIGVFSILSSLFNWQVNLMFITGILAVIGYSVNNTVVIYDRIRENVRMGVSSNYETLVNKSVIEAMGRTLNTSFTTLITLFALLLFVGASIQNFAIVLVIGIVAGMFNSIFIAPGILVIWDKREWGRFLNWLPGRT